MISSLLEKLNVSYEDLNTAEKETLSQWQKSLASKEITVEGIKDHVRTLIEAVERELADVQESTSAWKWISNRKKDIFLKARLKNYLMLHDFLSAPEKARKYIEQSLINIK
jgi:hypothetical protein